MCQFELQFSRVLENINRLNHITMLNFLYIINILEKKTIGTIFVLMVNNVWLDESLPVKYARHLEL